MPQGGNVFFIPPEFYGLPGIGQGLERFNDNRRRSRENAQADARFEQEQQANELAIRAAERQEQQANQQREMGLRALEEYNNVIALGGTPEDARLAVGPIATQFMSQEFFGGVDPSIAFESGALGVAEQRANVDFILQNTSLTKEEIGRVQLQTQEIQNALDDRQSFVDAARAEGKTLGMLTLEARNAEIAEVTARTNLLGEQATTEATQRSLMRAQIDAMRAEAAGQGDDAKLMATTVEAIHLFTNGEIVSGQPITPEHIRAYLTGGAGLSPTQQAYIAAAHDKVIASANADFANKMKSAGPDARLQLDLLNGAIAMNEAGVTSLEEEDLLGFFVRAAESVTGGPVAINRTPAGFFGRSFEDTLEFGFSNYADFEQYVGGLAPDPALFDPAMSQEEFIENLQDAPTAQLQDIENDTDNPAIRTVIQGILQDREVETPREVVRETNPVAGRTSPGGRTLSAISSLVGDSGFDETAHLRRPSTSPVTAARSRRISQLQSELDQLDAQAPLANDSTYATWVRRRRAKADELTRVRGGN